MVLNRDFEISLVIVCITVFTSTSVFFLSKNANANVIFAQDSNSSVIVENRAISPDNLLCDDGIHPDANVDACYNLIFKGALDYYGIKQQPTFDNKDTTSEEDSEKGSDSTKGQSDSSNSKTQSEKVQVTSGLYDVFR